MSVKKEYKLDLNIIDAYFQKSYRFLYPLLKIKNRTITPLQTFTRWQNELFQKDKKLICVFEIDNDARFKLFEKTSLFSNRYFFSYHSCEDNKGAYIFDMEPYSNEWDAFHNGKYSQFSKDAKHTILEYCSQNRYVREYMDSYLNPEKYFSKYSELLQIDEDELRLVGELCNSPDLNRETFLLEKIKEVI